MADANHSTGGSLADRLTKADGSKFEPPKAPPGINTVESTSSKPTGELNSWADEVETPVNADPEPAPAAAAPQDESEPSKPNKSEDSSLAKAQLDGATEYQAGSGNFLDEPSYDVNIKLSDVQADPNNPLYSLKSFEDLGVDPNILKGIYEMRFTKPSKIQEKALPLLLANPPMNMIGQSQSGTGKTAAFVLNILIRLDLSTPEARRRPQAMVLAPSRELARQIHGVIQIMGRYVEGLQIASAIPADRDNRGKFLDGQVVVGTPGTTMDIIKKRLVNPSGIKILVLDEADNMLDQQGLGDQCLRVKKMLPPDVQVVLFSATFPNYVVQYAEKFAPNSNQITLKHEELTVEGIKQLYLDCPTENDKYDSLVKLYGLMTIGSSIIFVKHRATAKEVERRMNQEGHQCACLTGEFEGSARDVVIDSFRKGIAKVLITTNVLSRGIDVQSVSLVVNYVSDRALIPSLEEKSSMSLALNGEQDLPDMAPRAHDRADCQTYLHRIGRTGRFGRIGVSISLICGQRDVMIMHEIENYFGIHMQGLNHDDWDEVERKIKGVLKSVRAQPTFGREPKEVDM
ncbi:MAG: hypothetical protein Q9166_001866 [cf. Caloplaca sp. 2 TL-2023]